MRIELPGGGIDYIKTHLKHGLLDHQSFAGSTNILLAVPEIARDPEIHDLLVRVLSTKFLGFRQHAAKVLHAIGDPLGILHLTYNTLKTHPILGLDHTIVSGWGELTAPFPDALTDKCIDLLVEDMRGDYPAFHGATLAYLPADKIVPRMLPLLKEGIHTARYAAYVLAAKQHESSLDILIDWLQPEKYKKWFQSKFYGKYLPLWAARNFPHDRLLAQIRDYADPNCDLLRNELQPKRDLLYYAQYICDLIDLDDSARVPWMMNKYHKQSIVEIQSPRMGVGWGEGVIRLNEPVSAYCNGAEHLFWDFRLLIDATPEERAHLAADQKENVLRMLHKNHLGYEQLLDGSTFPFIGFLELPKVGEELYPGQSLYGHSGLRIIYDEADYVRAATDWILHPDKHLVYLEKP